MSETWVMTDEDKQEKKEMAEIKKKLKQQANESNQRSVDLRNVPLSTYLQKRAQFKQEIKKVTSVTSPQSSVTSPESVLDMDEAEQNIQQQPQRSRNNSGEYF